MINGRVNESKESDFMKMKKILVSMFLLFLVLCLKSNVSNAAETDALNRWDLTKEYTVEQNSIRYHAYLSKDKKESWIFTADLLDKKKMLDIIIPQKIENAPVVIVGSTSGYEEILAKQNLGSVGIQGPDGSYHLDAEVTLWGDMLEPWHYAGPYKKNIKSITMPDTVTYLGAAAFAYTTSLETIHLPNQLASLQNYTFLGCKNLKKIDTSAKVKVEAKEVFADCDKLAGLTYITKHLQGDTLSFSNNMVIDLTEKDLVQVMPDAKKIIIPKNVKDIEATAFVNTNIKTLKVSKKNKYLATHKRCLYQKKSGELIYVFGKGSTLTLSKKIKKLSEDVVVTKAKLKKLIISHKVKRYNNWKKPFVKNNKKIKIYYRGKRVK
jgi:hypothetical protein